MTYAKDWCHLKKHFLHKYAPVVCLGCSAVVYKASAVNDIYVFKGFINKCVAQTTAVFLFMLETLFKSALATYTIYDNVIVTYQ